MPSVREIDVEGLLSHTYTSHTYQIHSVQFKLANMRILPHTYVNMAAWFVVLD